MRNRRIWVRDWLARRYQQGTYENLMQELRIGDEAAYKRFLRMTPGTFEILLNMVAPHIQRHDTRFRLAISAGERLAVTLRFLATGE
jgi:hypothetical protein